MLHSEDDLSEQRLFHNLRYMHPIRPTCTEIEWNSYGTYVYFSGPVVVCLRKERNRSCKSGRRSYKIKRRRTTVGKRFSPSPQIPGFGFYRWTLASRKIFFIRLFASSSPFSFHRLCRGITNDSISMKRSLPLNGR